MKNRDLLRRVDRMTIQSWKEIQDGQVEPVNALLAMIKEDEKAAADEERVGR